MCKFWPCRCSGTCEYHLCGLFGTRTFRQRGILAQGFFGIMDVLARGHLTHGNVCAEMSILLCKVQKYPRAEMFRCWNIPCPHVHGAKNSLCQNVPVQKSFCFETSMETQCPCACTSAGSKHHGMSWCWNIPAEMSLAEISGAEMVGSLLSLGTCNSFMDGVVRNWL